MCVFERVCVEDRELRHWKEASEQARTESEPFRQRVQIAVRAAKCVCVCACV